MRTAAVIALVLALAACGSPRRLELDFTGDDAALARIASVDVEVWSADGCACAELDVKPGCLAADRVVTLAFRPGASDRLTDALPAGKLVVRARPVDLDGAPVPMRLDCWCTVDREGQALVYPLGAPLDPAGSGCSDR